MHVLLRWVIASSGMLALVGCSPAGRERAATTDTAAGRGDRAPAVAAAAPAAEAVLHVPHDSLIPNDALGTAIRRGRAIFAATRDSLPRNVGGNLRCASCHLDNGTRAHAAPLIGVFARYPQYRPRAGAVVMIEDRVNDCLERSLNGSGIAWQSQEMRDIVAYIAFLSRGVTAPWSVPGQGLPKLDPLPADSARGAAVYAASCARCHGADGAGGMGGTVPALWGARSYNIAASMARLGPAAAFIWQNMPFDQPRTLTAQQAYDVAAYVNSHARPDFAGKVNDWPKGGEPADVPYRTRHMASAARR